MFITLKTPMNIDFNNLKKSADEFSLGRCLIMAQQSLAPDDYDFFVKAYNALIKNRKLDNKAIKE